MRSTSLFECEARVCSSAKHENDLFGSSWCYCLSAKYVCSSAKHENDLFGSSVVVSFECCRMMM